MKVEKAKSIIASMNITKHALIRFNERTKYNRVDEKFVKSYMISVLIKGVHIKYKKTAARREKIESVLNKNENKKAVVHGNHTFIFPDDYSALITVLNHKMNSECRYGQLRREKITRLPIPCENLLENEFFGLEAV